MEKIFPSRINYRINDFLAYRWEFMRRSPQYRSDYKKFLNAKKKVTNFKKLYEFVKKYHFYPLNYKLSAKKIIERIKKIPTAKNRMNMSQKSEEIEAVIFSMACADAGFAIYLDGWSKKKLGVLPSRIKRMKFESPSFSPKNMEINSLRVILNLQYYTKEELLHCLGSAIDMALAINCQRERKIMRFDLYDKYLKVYDPKSAGKSYEEIAESIQIDKYEDSNNAIQSVKSYYREAVKLIKGGYRQII